MNIANCEFCKNKGLEIEGNRFICDEIGEDFSLYMSDEDCSNFELDVKFKDDFIDMVRERIENIDEIVEIFKEVK